MMRSDHSMWETQPESFLYGRVSDPRGVTPGLARAYAERLAREQNWTLHDFAKVYAPDIQSTKIRTGGYFMRVFFDGKYFGDSRIWVAQGSTPEAAAAAAPALAGATMDIRTDMDGMPAVFVYVHTTREMPLIEFFVGAPCGGCASRAAKRASASEQPRPKLPADGPMGTAVMATADNRIAIPDMRDTAVGLRRVAEQAVACCGGEHGNGAEPIRISDWLTEVSSSAMTGADSWAAGGANLVPLNGPALAPIGTRASAIGAPACSCSSASVSMPGIEELDAKIAPIGTRASAIGAPSCSCSSESMPDLDGMPVNLVPIGTRAQCIGAAAADAASSLSVPSLDEYDDADEDMAVGAKTKGKKSKKSKKAKKAKKSKKAKKRVKADKKGKKKEKKKAKRTEKKQKAKTAEKKLAPADREKAKAARKEKEKASKQKRAQKKEAKTKRKAEKAKQAEQKSKEERAVYKEKKAKLQVDKAKAKKARKDEKRQKMKQEEVSERAEKRGMSADEWRASREQKYASKVSKREAKAELKRAKAEQIMAQQRAAMPPPQPQPQPQYQTPMAMPPAPVAPTVVVVSAPPAVAPVPVPAPIMTPPVPVPAPDTAIPPPVTPPPPQPVPDAPVVPPTPSGVTAPPGEGEDVGCFHDDARRLVVITPGGKTLAPKFDPSNPVANHRFFLRMLQGYARSNPTFLTHPSIAFALSDSAFDKTIMLRDGRTTTTRYVIETSTVPSMESLYVARHIGILNDATLAEPTKLCAALGHGPVEVFTGSRTAGFSFIAEMKNGAIAISGAGQSVATAGTAFKVKDFPNLVIVGLRDPLA